MITMRSAFKKWLLLHNEDFRAHGHIRVPNWFRWYMRKAYDWRYCVTNQDIEYHCNLRELTYEQRRRYIGQYVFLVEEKRLEEDLMTLERPERNHRYVYMLKLWESLSDIPMNPETECIEEKWEQFPAGTYREDIWHWFESEFDVSVVRLMYR